MHEPLAHHLPIGVSGVGGGWHDRPRRSRQMSRMYELLPQRAVALLIDALIWLGLLVIGSW